MLLYFMVFPDHSEHCRGCAIQQEAMPSKSLSLSTLNIPLHHYASFLSISFSPSLFAGVKDKGWAPDPASQWPGQ